MIVNADGSEVTAFHGLLSGIPALGVPPIEMILQGESYGPFTITPGVAGDVDFHCTATSCGNPEQHESMLGTFHFVP